MKEATNTLYRTGVHTIPQVNRPSLSRR